MHISSSTEHHSYLPKSGPFELNDSAERRQVLKVRIITKDCSLNKPAMGFFPSLETKKNTLQVFKVNALYFISASEIGKETVTG